MRIKNLSLYKSIIKIICLIEEDKNSLSNQLHYEIQFHFDLQNANQFKNNSKGAGMD